MLNERWAQALLRYELSLAAPDFPASESGHIGRAAIDGTIVVYDLDDPPAWLQEVLDRRDEDGFTEEFWASREAIFDTRIADMDTELNLEPESEPEFEGDLTDSLTIGPDTDLDMSLLGLWRDRWDSGVEFFCKEITSDRAGGRITIDGNNSDYSLPISSLRQFYEKV